MVDFSTLVALDGLSVRCVATNAQQGNGNDHD